MTATQRKEVGDYLMTVGLAVVFSLPMGFMRWFPHVPWILQILLWGIPFGTAIYFAKSVQQLARFRSFALTTLVGSVLLALCIAVAFALAFLLLISAETHESPISSTVLQAVLKVLTSRPVEYAALLCFVGVWIVSSVFQISRKLGPGVLRNWLLGKYHEPHEEERIFMFLDMKDSTTLAERLGAIRFSALVKDFFADLTDPVLETRAEVSHYIGDEAVLSWSPRKGIEGNNCLRLFFLFQKRLDARSNYYEKRYGLTPGFKAGAHIGHIVATEVGDLKSEIVYHGDVLNTAARIQAMCNGLEESFLISGELRAHLTHSMPYGLSSLGRHLLKGKEHDVEIFAVSPGAMQMTAPAAPLEEDSPAARV